MILGVDPGQRRVGLAIADLETRFARPLEVVDTRTTDPTARIKELVAELGVTGIVVGRPVTLAGGEGPAMDAHKTFVVGLRSAVEIDVDVYDERMTTVIAERALKDSGASAGRRKEIRDAVAAQVMLQGFLDSRV